MFIVYRRETHLIL